MNICHRSYQQAQKNARRIIFHPLVGLLLFGLFLRAWSDKMPIYDTVMDWILYPFALLSTFVIFVLYSFIGGLTIINWKRLSGEMKVLIPAVGFMGLIGTLPKVFEVFSLQSIILWFGVLSWIYFFHTCEEGVVTTQRWLVRMLRLFSPTYQLGLRLEKSALVGYHPWGVLKTFQYGLGLYVVTTVLDISFRIWG